MSYAVTPFVHPRAGLAGVYTSEICLAPSLCARASGPSATKTALTTLALFGTLALVVDRLRR